jgi:DNA-binding NarL/FixJ family response regulator
MIRIRVLVADDHPLFRRGLVEMLAEEPDIEVVGEAGDGLEAIQKAGSLAPDVVFMDLNMPGQNGNETTSYLVQQWPQIKVLVLTVSEEPASLFQLLGLGAVGYVLKTASPQEIVDALRQVYQGWVVISPAMAPRLLADLRQPAEAQPTPGAATVTDAEETHLTPREQEVLQHVARGLSNGEIASALLVSENTVKSHIKNILGRLHMKSRRQAAAYAAGLGLGPAGPGDAPRRGR